MKGEMAKLRKEIVYILGYDEWHQANNPTARVAFEKADRILAALARERDAHAAALEEDVQAARAIGDSFFEALKPLNLQAINVANPGQHVSDLIALVGRLEKALQNAHEELTNHKAVGFSYFCRTEVEKLLADLDATR